MKTIKVFAKKVSPEKGTKSSAGYDLVCPERTDLHPHQQAKIFLETKLIIPKGIVCFLMPRSSCSVNLGLSNTIGTIDADFHQELFAKVYHRGVTDTLLTIEQNERFLQLVFLKLADEEIEAIESEEDFDNCVLEAETFGERTGGDGSTGRF